MQLCRTLIWFVARNPGHRKPVIGSNLDNESMDQPKGTNFDPDVC